MGLARARLLGVEKAVAPILLFLDSHCEVEFDFELLWTKPNCEVDNEQILRNYKRTKWRLHVHGIIIHQSVKGSCRS